MAPTRSRDAPNNASTVVRVGSKRKRVGSANENASINGRGSRATGKFKRQRSQNESSEEDFSSQHTMEVDDVEENPEDWSSDLSDAEEALLDDCEYTFPSNVIRANNNYCSIADEYLIHQADSRELNRLRKDELVRLYALAGLADSPDDLTKSELINSIISGRLDDEELPPSSPPSKTDGGFSSDEGHDGGGEETDAVHSSRSPLRRRSTVQEFSRTVKRTAIALGRSFSMGTDDGVNGSGQQKKSARISEDVKSPCHNVYQNGTSRYV